jgi:hypothetical protein
MRKILLLLLFFISFLFTHAANLPNIGYVDPYVEFDKDMENYWNDYWNSSGYRPFSISILDINPSDRCMYCYNQALTVTADVNSDSFYDAYYTCTDAFIDNNVQCPDGASCPIHGELALGQIPTPIGTTCSILFFISGYALFCFYKHNKKNENLQVANF